MQAKTHYKNTKELLSKNFPPEKSSLLQALHLIQKTQGFVSDADMLDCTRDYFHKHSGNDWNKRNGGDTG